MADEDTDADLAAEFIDSGWEEIDLMDAYLVLDDALEYMDEEGYI